MAKRDILKEAIADAKTVKETAIANAKAALEEAFTPQLKSMLAAKLEEMDKDEEKEEIEEMTAKEKSEGDDRKDDKIEKETEEMRESEEINLDEILAEIEGELEEDARTDAEEEGYEDGEKDAEEDMEDEEDDSEEEEIDLEDMTDEDLKSFIEDVIADMVGSGELEAGENFEEEDEDVEVEDDVDIEVDSEEEVEIEENNIDSDTGPKSFIKKNPDYVMEKQAMEKAKAKAEKELKEAHATINTLRSSLNEVNLLNAKLLYTNKIFKAKNLTESQKVKVLGAFDKAGTVKETKLVFETLNEGLKSKKSPIKESLGAASKATGNFKNTKNPIIKTDPMVARFQKLAGLK